VTAEEIARAADLRGKTAVLTGASSGLGVETARALAIAGANLVLGVRDPAKGEAVARDVAPEARVLSLDLADLPSVMAFAEQIGGPVDLLIANAGVSRHRTPISRAASTSVSRPITSAISFLRLD
jgi:NAD(P)-dependent dehydrogenase (short-subunit alcohol dehydrogenase family)